MNVLDDDDNELIIREIFESVDLDSSGFIDEHELAAVVDLNPDDLKEIFQQLDTNKDGKISVEEFVENYKYFQKVADENSKKLQNDEDDVDGKIQTDSHEDTPHDSGYSMSEPTHRKSRPPLKNNIKRKAAKYLG